MCESFRKQNLDACIIRIAKKIELCLWMDSNLELIIGYGKKVDKVSAFGSLVSFCGDQASSSDNCEE